MKDVLRYVNEMFDYGASIVIIIAILLIVPGISAGLCYLLRKHKRITIEILLALLPTVYMVVLRQSYWLSAWDESFADLTGGGVDAHPVVEFWGSVLMGFGYALGGFGAIMTYVMCGRFLYRGRADIKGTQAVDHFGEKGSLSGGPRI